MTAAKLSRTAADGETSNSRGDAELLKTVVSSLEEDIVLGRLHPRERLIEEYLSAIKKDSEAVIRLKM